MECAALPRVWIESSALRTSHGCHSWTTPPVMSGTTSERIAKDGSARTTSRVGIAARMRRTNTTVAAMAFLAGSGGEGQARCDPDTFGRERCDVALGARVSALDGCGLRFWPGQFKRDCGHSGASAGARIYRSSQ